MILILVPTALFCPDISMLNYIWNAGVEKELFGKLNKSSFANFQQSR